MDSPPVRALRMQSHVLAMDTRQCYAITATKFHRRTPRATAKSITALDFSAGARNPFDAGRANNRINQRNTRKNGGNQRVHS